MTTPEKPGDSLIGPTVFIRGAVTARQERLTIMGTVEGQIDHDQALTIHRDGKIDGDIRAQEVLVEGTVDGNIHGLKRVRIAQTGRVNGNVYSQLFSVDEGAKIKGNVIMDADAGRVDQPLQGQEPQSREALPAKSAESGADGAAEGGMEDAKTTG